MKNSLNLTMIATLLLGIFNYNIAIAQVVQAKAPDNKGSENKKSQDVRIFINNQQRSLYQIALLSNISVTELRDLNKGSFINTDIVKVGDSIVLPTDSKLLPAENKNNKKEDKYHNLPSLGSSDKAGDSVVSSGDTMESQIATVLQTLGQQDWSNMSSTKLKDDLNSQTQGYAENYVRSQVNSQLIDPIRSAAQDFLGRFGTAQLQFDVSDQAKLNNVNVKLFSPWYDSDSTVIFSQLTYQEYEKDRRIGNFGIGQRWDFADKKWLVGYNLFFDHDFGRNHNRLGLGLEAWADYIKFAANYYTPLSDWKDSKDFDDYLERAARGYDFRFQGYLPSYPHLGGSLMFEQYFGDKVALFGKDNLQKDPYAVTVGVDYTPVPLFTIKGEHKQGESANKMAKVELTMNYRLGVPLKDQLNPNMVDAARSLRGSRYDLVDRNNYIVLEYKEKKFSVDLASLGEWEEGTILPLGISVHNAKGTLLPLSWGANYAMDLATLSTNNGDLCYNRGSQVAGTHCSTSNLWNGSVGIASNDIANWSVLVPDYLNSLTGERNPLAGTTAQSGRYTFDVTLTDGNGRVAKSNTS
ncbi:inverse autotransporter beta domain-containing protein [Orbus mooreae]|uniref:inverse autotransporter beta domain-containing protein n=1 Tax=Orbus mooreae TaxID=3074107 RepID=UPI00370D20D4